MSKEQQQQAINENQLFQQFTKSSQICSNSFQMIFEGAVAVAKENQMLKELLKQHNIKIPSEPLPEGTIVASPQSEATPPNRKQRRAEAKKKAK